MRRSSAVVVAALVGGVLVAGGVASAAPTSSPAVENSIGFKLGCDGYEHLAVDIADVFHSTGVTVSAPEKVVAGSTFTYRVQPNVMSVPTGGHAGRSVGKWTRLKYDFDIPAGVSLVDAQVVAGTSSNLSGVTPSVIRINDGGSPDGAGTHLRISGNNQTADSNNKGGNGPSTSKNSDGGIEVGAGKTFRLPAIDVTVVAGAAGSTVQPKLRATDGDSGAFNSPKNAFTFLQYETLWPGYWERYNCSPRDSSGGGLNAGGQALATVNVVSQAGTATAVTSGAAATVGQSTDLVAQVSPAPTGGTVQFKDGGTDIGAPVAVVNGVATLPHTFTAAGDHSITAVYDGVLEFLTSTSPARTVSVAAADVQTTASLTVPSSAVEQTSVALTANISPAANGGTVQFKDGGIDIGGPIAVTGGAATLDHTFTTTGSHSITAVYSGTAGFGGSTAQAQTIEISSSSLSTTTTLQVPATAVTGTAVDLTATVAPNNAVGSVQFKSNGTAIGSPVAVASGVAMLSHAFDTAGAQSVTADFTAGAGFVSSSASAQTVTVSDPAPVDVVTTTSLSVPATAVTGTAVDLTATVAPNNAVGTVQFKSNGTSIGSPVAVASGVATLSHTFDTAGAQSVTADFTAGAGFVSSSAPAQTVTVSDPAPVDVQTMTSLSVPATAVTGTVVDLTATVAPNNAVGSVQFKSNGTAIGSPVTVSAGVATLSHAFDTAGAQSVTADFTAGAGFVSSSASARTVTVSDPAPVDVETTTSLSVPATAVTGTAVDLTATVAPNNAVGSVQFKSNGTAIGAPVTVSGGTATLSHSFDAAGAQSITANFTAGAGFKNSVASAKSVQVSVADQESVVELNIPTDAKTGVATDLWATVRTSSDDAVGVGTVQFYDGGVAIGGPEAVTAGAAGLTHSFTSAGAHSITAVYSGGAGVVGSSAQARTVNVTDPAPSDVTTETVVTAPADAVVNKSVTLSATVSSVQNGGTVQFMDGDTPIGDAVAVVNGIAALNHTFTTTGTHSISAIYSGATGFTGSTSTAHAIQIKAATGGGTGSLGSGSAGSSDFLPFGS
ncbi:MULTISPECIES: beta strand repeat-containing protein [unclassified Rhodococcus (in: high G+C Gram-positive bacteria)]|uniref:beta strand repeat-containing protein n=1 Tax=unclassified Rhodococcus (in: high G+C Gram-positive bacteria) TaxID=192944 RepID=UPI0024B811E0|nr:MULTISPECIES: Ig-like domain-containing protein [unclassified Rhodococcus (in: high G+C Gram-positive bacteria)]MDI9960148.1 Ig-like domain-containing protein [Rhodococcus sp. IEGM 1237]MDI9966004.1 Ig-like domain-containing protein [Rhodococcus sp. IEGM 1251]MDV8128328.1 Ig-like domain-containing protein [Rhodococcus sp. IEGM 1304]